ncbi:MAG: cysteine desulfurase [Ignavibacteria bacterium]|nr:cysteine desulfurase [Ignavibacteria bacterium]
MDLIYADYAATTPTDPRVLELMLPYFTDEFYNAASTHIGGQQAQRVVMKARMDIARHIGGVMNEIIFTSGSTEGINLAIMGSVRAALAEGGSGRRKVVTMQTEHAAVRDAADQCRMLGCEVVYLPADSNGRVSIEAAQEQIDANTIIVSVMVVNNETGVVQDLKSIADIAHQHGALFMTDGTQAYGKLPIHVDEFGIDIMMLSGHKIYGPKGIGAMYVRQRKKFSCQIEPMMFGGGQEFGFRSGTINVPGVVGLAAAGEIALQTLVEESQRINSLREYFEREVCKLHDVSINGAGACRNYNISNVLFEHADVASMIRDMPAVACSKGSACSSAKTKASPVLLAMGRTEEQANQSLRFSFGRGTTENDVDRLLQEITRAHARNFIK